MKVWECGIEEAVLVKDKVGVPAAKWSAIHFFDFRSIFVRNQIGSSLLIQFPNKPRNAMVSRKTPTHPTRNYG